VRETFLKHYSEADLTQMAVFWRRQRDAELSARGPELARGIWTVG